VSDAVTWPFLPELNVPVAMIGPLCGPRPELSSDGSLAVETPDLAVDVVSDLEVAQAGSPASVHADARVVLQATRLAAAAGRCPTPGERGTDDRLPRPEERAGAWEGPGLFLSSGAPPTGLGVGGGDRDVGRAEAREGERVREGLEH